jgi:hypothetical protein
MTLASLKDFACFLWNHQDHQFHFLAIFGLMMVMKMIVMVVENNLICLSKT